MSLLFLFLQNFPANPLTIRITTLFKIASSTSFVVFSSARTLGSSKLVLILLHFTYVLRGPSARSETTLSCPRGIQRRLADTSDSNHSRLVNALRAAYTTFGTHALWLPGRSPTESQKATDRSVESQSHLARNKSPTETCYKNLVQ